MPIDMFFVSSHLLWAIPHFLEESQVIKDESKDHGTVDGSFSEQQICESVDYTLIVRKTGALGLVQPGLMAGWLTVRGTTDEIQHFKILYRLNTWLLAIFNKGLALLQHCWCI